MMQLLLHIVRLQSYVSAEILFWRPLQQARDLCSSGAALLVVKLEPHIIRKRWVSDKVGDVNGPLFVTFPVRAASLTVRYRLLIDITGVHLSHTHPV